MFKPYRLEIIGRAIVAMSLYGLIVMPIYKVAKFFYIPGRIEKVKKPRMYASLGALAVIILAILFIPLPYTVMCSLELQPRDAVPVYSASGGRLEEVSVRPGDPVKRGQKLARLSNVDLDLEVTRLAGELDVLKVQEKNLSYGQRDMIGLDAVQRSLRETEKQWRGKKRDQEGLILTAPIDGTVLPPPARPHREPVEGQLPGWEGTPLEAENLGCRLQEQDMFCQVGNPTEFDAVLVIDQTDVEFVREMLREDQLPQVEIKLDELPHDVFNSAIEEIGSEEMEFSSRALAAKAGGDVPTETDPTTGAERPQSPSY
ncbi:MAG: biotin/lipoyl-binding protein, partial [Planctomycetales bacterium]|nr:biotin/lipoyl-binding protein [Planctomycetales bacterium]